MDKKYIVITDGRKLRYLARQFNFEYDKKHKYIINLPSNSFLNDYNFKNQLKKYNYDLKYFSGCFNPYIIQYV